MSKTLSQLNDLTGKNAVVIGGSGFLGAAGCEVLAELGANVTIASRTLKKCEEVVKLLAVKGDSQQHRAYSVDVTDNVSMQEFANKVSEQVDGIDILILTAWNGRKNSWETINLEDWKYDIDICLTSNFMAIKLLENNINDGAKIILVSSMYGIVAPSPKLYEGVPQANPPSYGAAKAGVIQLTKYLSAWLAHRKINVNCISPGPFPFDFVRNDYPEFIKRLKERTLLDRVGEPDDLKGVFALLSTSASDYITGQNLSVDGGWTIC